MQAFINEKAAEGYSLHQVIERSTYQWVLFFKGDLGDTEYADATLTQVGTARQWPGRVKHLFLHFWSGVRHSGCFADQFLAAQSGLMEVVSVSGRRVIAGRDVDVEVLLRILRSKPQAAAQCLRDRGAGPYCWSMPCRPLQQRVDNTTLTKPSLVPTAPCDQQPDRGWEFPLVI